MGAETKETSGPIRRFPTGFWASFNQWWHGEFARLGQRPSSKAIGKWHAENAQKVWGDQAVSYSETQRHANRMKCRRTGQQFLRQSAEDDDDDDDYAMEVGGADAAAEKGTLDRMAMERGAAQQQAVQDRSGGAAAEDSPFSNNCVGMSFDAYSDPPGTLKSYMNADSDVPAPAAPSRHVVKRIAVGKASAQPSWMQPDPTVPHGCPRQQQGAELGLAGLSWDSAFSVVERPSEAPSSSLGQRDSQGSLLTSSNTRTAKRGRETGVSSAPAIQDTPVGEGDAQQLQLHPRSNPFGDLAAAAAASAGCSVTSAMPAARDAAALLNSVTLSGALRFNNADQQPEPSWLHKASCELDILFQELGISALDGGKLPVLWRSRTLCSQEPLRLPESRPKRDLDALLKRGLLRETAAGADGNSARGGSSASAACMSEKEIRGRLLHGRGHVRQGEGNGGGQAGAAWCATALHDGSSGAGAGLMGLTAIEDMPLEALL